MGKAAPLLVIALSVLAYSNAQRGPFVFDDLPAIVENELLPPEGLRECLTAPPGSTASGRPLVALSFALNHALSGMEVSSWRATNLLLHTLTALALLALARATLASAGREGRAATVIALLWSAHPLLTDAVNLVASRSELLVSLAYLCVLLCLMKCAEAPRPWSALCVLACCLGMASKEVMLSAPLIALAWDRTFLTGSWRAAWRARRGLYMWLAASWLILLACILTGDRGASVTLGADAVSPLRSLLTQAGAITHYISLTFWPTELSIDYADWPIARGMDEVLPELCLISSLLALAIWRVRAKHPDGLLLLTLFALLAPSSSVIPLTGELVAEHRMYLASASLIALTVLATERLFARTGLVFLCLILTPLLHSLTMARNEEWASARTIWERATEVRPTNARAWNSLGVALEAEGLQAAAADAWREALAHDPDDYRAHSNLGEHYAGLNEGARAISHLQSAVSLRPDHLELRFNLGTLLLRSGDPAGAEMQLSEALQRAQSDWELREIAERRLARARAQR